MKHHDKNAIYKKDGWVKNQHDVLGKTYKEIAKECGVSGTTINRWYNDKNKEMGKARSKRYYKKNIKKCSEVAKAYREVNSNYLKESSLKDYYTNREHYLNLNKEYKKNNKQYILEKNRARNENYKMIALNILGGCRCIECGDTDLSHLTIDHINGGGTQDRKRNKLFGTRFYISIAKGRYPPENLKDLRVLCYNHNLGRQRGYLDIPLEKQNRRDRYRIKLWKEAFRFFGPCKTCGENELKFLSISHIHNDGAEHRRNGGGSGIELLAKFRKIGWKSSIRDDFCFECFNCNCSRKYFG
jgi:transcriptional regulator with XRE-family HTH domain